MSDDDADRAVLRAALQVIEEAELPATRLAARRRRLRRALRDLGLDRVTGTEWCRIGDSGFEFSELDGRQADQLVRALEDLAERLPPRPPPLPGPGQLGLGI